MERSEVSRWFDEYSDAFASCGRGETDTTTLLAYYSFPALLTTDGGFFALMNDDHVLAALRTQVEEVRAAGYSRSETLESTVSILNATSALCTGTFSRQRSDGGEISRLTATYLVTDGAAGRRIAMVAVHSP